MTVDQSSLTFRRSQRLAGADQWMQPEKVRWTSVRDLMFDGGPYEEVWALYCVPTSGHRRYLFDCAHLSRAEWRQFADLVRVATDGRLDPDPGECDTRAGPFGS